MYSEYEENARRAAVEAVERRWERQNAIARKSRRAAGLGWWGLAVVFMLGLCGALIVTVPHFRDAVSDFVKRWNPDNEVSAAPYGVVNAELLGRYCQAVESFATGRSLRWRDAPADIKPNTAKAGKAYPALVEYSSGGYDIYEITTLGEGRVSVALLSPQVKPVTVPMEAFSKACSGRKYFISYEGVIYACGKAAIEDVKNLSARLRGGQR